MTITLIIAFVNLNVVLGHVHWFIGFSFLVFCFQIGPPVKFALLVFCEKFNWGNNGGRWQVCKVIHVSAQKDVLGT